MNAGDRPWIRVGAALCGQAAGCDEVLGAIEAAIRSRDLTAQVSRVGCLGLCFAEPLVDVQLPGQARVFYGNVTPQLVEEIVESHLGLGVPLDRLALGQLGEPSIAGISDLNQHPMRAKENRVAMRNVGNIDPDDIYQYVANGGYAALSQALSEGSPENTLEQVNLSGLRGRGGANYGYIFIRHGHDGPIERAQTAVQQAYQLGLLGEHILGSDFSFDLEVALTGDSYVSGEETALMEAIEGSRAMPRFRPPFPAQVGVFGKPTNINNVKTLAYVPEIVSRGGEWFANIGYEQSTGTAILCLTGSLRYTGMVEVPMGVTLSDVLYQTAGGVPGGKALKLVQTGGPLGGVLGADSVDLVLDFETFRNAGAILGSGGIIAADEDTCIVDLTRVLIAFCQYESCGKCFPCRMGMTHLLEVLERICRLEGAAEDLDLMRRIGVNMQAGSLCGHGQLGFNPVSSALQYFGGEFEEHISERRCATGRCQAPRFTPKLTLRGTD